MALQSLGGTVLVIFLWFGGRALLASWDDRPITEADAAPMTAAALQNLCRGEGIDCAMDPLSGKLDKSDPNLQWSYTLETKDPANPRKVRLSLAKDGSYEVQMGQPPPEPPPEERPATRVNAGEVQLSALWSVLIGPAPELGPPGSIDPCPPDELACEAADRGRALLRRWDPAAAACSEAPLSWQCRPEASCDPRRGGCT